MRSRSGRGPRLALMLPRLRLGAAASVLAGVGAGFVILAAPGTGVAHVHVDEARATVRPCAVSRLRLHFDAAQSAAGRVSDTFAVVNTGGRCALRGYPGVTAIDTAGAPLRLTVTKNRMPGATPRLVVLKSHASAPVSLLATPPSSGAADCLRVRLWRFLMPGAHERLGATHMQTVCSQRIVISAIGA